MINKIRSEDATIAGLTCLLLLLMSYSVIANDSSFERTYSGTIGFNATEYDCDHNPYVCNGSLSSLNDKDNLRLDY